MVRTHHDGVSAKHLPRLRVAAASWKTFSQEVATSMLNRHVSGAFGSCPPMIPVLSVFAASYRCA